MNKIKKHEEKMMRVKKLLQETGNEEDEMPAYYKYQHYLYYPSNPIEDEDYSDFNELD